MKSGTRIVYTYKHPKHRIAMMSKYGTYYGLIRHTYKHQGPQLALVQFDGNKKASKVPFQKLSEKK